jgi:hypothetical protein
MVVAGYDMTLPRKDLLDGQLLHDIVASPLDLDSLHSKAWAKVSDVLVPRATTDSTDQ